MLNAEQIRKRAEDAFNSTPGGDPLSRDIEWQAIVDELMDCVDAALKLAEGAGPPQAKGISDD